MKLLPIYKENDMKRDKKLQREEKKTNPESSKLIMFSIGGSSVVHILSAHT